MNQPKTMLTGIKYETRTEQRVERVVGLRYPYGDAIMRARMTIYLPLDSYYGHVDIWENHEWRMISDNFSGSANNVEGVFSTMLKVVTGFCG